MSFNKDFVVIDLETLGVSSDAIILSAGVVHGRYEDKNLNFDDLIRNGMYRKFNVEEQRRRGRRTSRRVIKWWFGQSEESKKVLKPDSSDTLLYNFPAELEAYIQSRGLNIRKVDFYDRKNFDLSKIQYLYEEDLGRDIPWNPNYEYEVATAFRFMGMDRYAGIQVSDIRGAVYHNALHDAAVDALRLSKALHNVEPE